jgi:Fe-Mn family superoxide dismutase
MKRREFLDQTSRSLALLALAPLSLPQSSLLAETTPHTAGQQPPLHQLPALNYAFGDLEPHLDARTMELHYTQHHATYIARLNDALAPYPDHQNKTLPQLFRQLPELPEPLRTAIRNHGGGHWNHTFFWDILTPLAEKRKRTPATEAALTRAFGGYDLFKYQFSLQAKNVFGSGWVWWVYHAANNQHFIVPLPNQENPLMFDTYRGCTPILALDVWEHAYYLKYQSRRADYIDAFWNVVNWSRIDELLAKA